MDFRIFNNKFSSGSSALPQDANPEDLDSLPARFKINLSKFIENRSQPDVAKTIHKDLPEETDRNY
ncbi:MAG: hypothetical protein OEY93_02860 [Anaerolineae bacterium]|nr:hypothetical protein [Anaerolineae bacterium]